MFTQGRKCWSAFPPIFVQLWVGLKVVFVYRKQILHLFMKNFTLLVALPLTITPKKKKKKISPPDAQLFGVRFFGPETIFQIFFLQKLAQSLPQLHTPPQASQQILKTWTFVFRFAPPFFWGGWFASQSLKVSFVLCSKVCCLQHLLHGVKLCEGMVVISASIKKSLYQPG